MGLETRTGAELKTELDTGETTAEAEEATADEKAEETTAEEATAEEATAEETTAEETAGADEVAEETAGADDETVEETAEEAAEETAEETAEAAPAPEAAYSLSCAANDFPVLSTLLSPDEASHNMNPPKLALSLMEEVTYFSTVAKSA